MKTTAAFKLDRQVKRYLACIDNKHSKGAVKKLFIQAQLAESFQPRRERVKREGNTD